jgi:glycosyltransferase involved in cell wall biosynthesis
MSRGKVSVIIPSRVEPYVGKTIQDILDNAVGDIEIILVLDGVTPDHELPDDKRLKIYRNSKVMGLRASLNAAIDVSRSKYIFKIDAHCTVGEGWDKILKAEITGSLSPGGTGSMPQPGR